MNDVNQTRPLNGSDRMPQNFHGNGKVISKDRTTLFSATTLSAERLEDSKQMHDSFLLGIMYGARIVGQRAVNITVMPASILEFVRTHELVTIEDTMTGNLKVTVIERP